jgi:hypothetical protein
MWSEHSGAVHRGRRGEGGWAGRSCESGAPQREVAGVRCKAARDDRSSSGGERSGWWGARRRRWGRPAAAGAARGGGEGRRAATEAAGERLRGGG